LSVLGASTKSHVMLCLLLSIVILNTITPVFHFQEEAKYIMHLTINKISDADEGDYFCHAENAFGSGTRPVSVRIRNVVSIITTTGF
jgi:hypothetical protein